MQNILEMGPVPYLDHWLVWLAIAVLVLFLWRRFLTVAAMLRAISFTPPATRLLSRLVKTHNYDFEQFLRADGADERWIEPRRRGMHDLAVALRAGPQSEAFTETVRDGLSDLRFADTNRVPFPFAQVMREHFSLGSVAIESKGPRLCDLDDQWTLDLSGSYGVNVAGNERYKRWLEEGWQQVRDLGPVVLGPLHPLVRDNLERLKRISGLDEASFHMSGTEAVMAAVRLVRFNKRRKKIVVFAGAYHGWWDGVQPGLGSERNADDVITLKDMHPASLDLIRLRSKEIAGVIVNPVQSFHPNSPPPNDAVLLNSEMRDTRARDSEYAQWLKRLRDICSKYGVPLIFDEVYSGFRLAPGGAQTYYGVRADMVVYGKTLGGGMPVGVVCGQRELMRRFDPGRPMRIAYVVGTFSAHPLTMGAMNEFLR